MEYTYLKHLFVFMDILGYKSIVDEAENNIEEAAHIIKNIDKLVSNCIKKQLDRLQKDFETDYVIFSDSICVAIPIEKTQEDKYMDYLAERLRFLTYIVANIQLYALEYGIILRGAITIGNYFRNENIMFSKALIDAYTAESKKAIYPRVILYHESSDELLTAYIKAKITYGEFLYLQEEEDFVFVNYLANANEFYNSIFIRELVIKQRNIIEQGIIKFEENDVLLEKYAWLMNYHNTILHKKFSDLLVTDKYRKICANRLGYSIFDMLEQLDQNNNELDLEMESYR